MTIIFYDGTTFECTSLYVSDKEIITDDKYVFPLIEVQRIEER